MKPIRTTIYAVCLTAALGGTAISYAATPPATQNDAQNTESMRHGGHDRHGGPDGGFHHVLDQLDLTQLVLDRVDLQRVVAGALDRLDLTAIVVERVDLGDVVATALQHVDLTQIVMSQVDLIGVAQYVVDGVDLPGIIRDSTGSVASEAMVGLRMQGIDADVLVGRVVDRMLRRRRERRTEEAPEPPDSSDASGDQPAGNAQ